MKKQMLEEVKPTVLKDDERLDYLMTDDHLQIIQSPTVFSYSLDAVLLADFASVPIKRGHILDLCSGHGVIPLLLSGRSNAQIKGLEIQSRLHNMATRNIALNQLEAQIEIIEGDLKERHGQLPQSFFDTVTCNPPYFSTPKATEYNHNAYLTIARHEVLCTLEDVIKACKLYVKPGGKVALVHRPERLVEIITWMKQYQIEPKRMQLVYPTQEKASNTLLIEGMRDGKPGLKIAPPLIVYKSNGDYTEAARKIIYGA